MGLSLQEQLLKAGLVDKTKATAAEKERQKQTKKQHKGQVAQPDSVAIAAAQAEKAARDREMNRKRQEELKRRELAAQVRQLVEQGRVTLEGAEEPYHFTDGPMARRLLVTPAVRKGLADGRYAVARLDKGYAIIPAETAERVAERDPAAIVLRHRPEEKPTEVATDDPYAGFEVPDDLMW